MITIEDQFVVHRPLSEVWQFFDDFAGLAACVPTLQEFSIVSEREIEGKVGVTLGAIPVTSKVRIEVTEKREPTCIQAIGVSYLGETIATQLARDAGNYKVDDTGLLYLHLDLQDEGGAATRVMFCAGVEAEGKLRKMYESIIRLKVPAMKAEFRDKVARALGSECAIPETVEAMCADLEAVRRRAEAGDSAISRGSTAEKVPAAGWWTRFLQRLRRWFGGGPTGEEAL